MDNKYNTGQENTGDCNTGDCNTSCYNTGNRNTGDFNTGSHNTGNGNTGNENTGACNTGDCNTGSSNTGDWNTGRSNTGDWNTGSYNTGYCNSITPQACFIFNKPARREDWENAHKPEWMYIELIKWVHEQDMSDAEKEAYPSYATTGGYLKAYSSLKQAYIEAWESTTEEDRELTKKLPNFDPVVFEEVFGFNPFKKTTKKITIDGKDIEISEDSFEELKKQLLKG